MPVSVFNTIESKRWVQHNLAGRSVVIAWNLEMHAFVSDLRI